MHALWPLLGLFRPPKDSDIRERLKVKRTKRIPIELERLFEKYGKKVYSRVGILLLAKRKMRLRMAKTTVEKQADLNDLTLQSP